jgi:esterase/lipase superfamily enzyme
MPRSWIQALFFLSLLAGCATPLPDDAPLQVLVPVLYATNRSLGDTETGGIHYTTARGPMTFGSASVALSTRKEGDSPFADWTSWQPRHDGARNRNELLRVEPLDAEAFDALINRKAEKDGDQAVLLYVHGFRRDFDIVAMETAAIAYETGLNGIPMFFSWPSANSVFSYVNDITNMRWAAADLRDTLKYLLNESHVSTVHLIAHSLGGSGLLEALDDLAQDGSVRTDKLGEIVLTSPDVDVDLFRRDYLPVLRKLEVRVTLYITDSDVPLQASHRVNGVNRLGDAKSEIFIADGVETVVFSDVVTILNSHDAHVEIGDLQADLHYLIEEGLDANRRPTLEAVESENGRYWRAQPFSDRD